MPHAAMIGEMGVQRGETSAAPLFQPRVQIKDAASFRDALTARASDGPAKAVQRSASSGGAAEDPMVVQPAAGKTRLLGGMVSVANKLDQSQEQTGSVTSAKQASCSLL